jgi:rare lipoprotein A
MALRLCAGGTALWLAACGSLPEQQSAPSKPKPPASSGRYSMAHDRPPSPSEIPPEIARTPDPEPVDEPISRSGNPDFYTVYGKTYVVQKTRKIGWRESGNASWYAKKFHGHKTASGEVYDMFAMTAAHKSLPLPSYVRVTRTDNGKSCIVRVNDRGPFHRGRIIDLSYAAAARLDMIRIGEAPVEIEVISAGEARPAQTVVAAATPAAVVTAAPDWKPGYWVVGSFDDPIDATLLREDLRGAGLAADLQSLIDGGASLLRVVVGPFAEEPASRAAAEQLRARGLEPVWRVN